MKKEKRLKRSRLKQILSLIDYLKRKVALSVAVEDGFADFGANSRNPEFFVEEMEDHELEYYRDLRKGLRKDLHHWLRNSDEGETRELVQTLTPGWRREIRKLVKKQYKKYFHEPDFTGLPNDICCPTIFSVVNRNVGTMVALRKPIIRTYGKHKAIIKGIALYPEDGQLTFALLLLMNQKPCDYTEAHIHYRVSENEIAKTMLKINPSAEDTRNAIWSGLERLRGCVIKIVDDKGQKTVGGILSKAKELDQDSNLEIDIYLDRDFVNLIAEGFTKLDRQIYFKLHGAKAALYVYLMRQLSFQDHGTLNPQFHPIRQVYDSSGMAGLQGQTDKTQAQIRYELRKTLNGLLKRLRSENVRYRFSLPNDRLKIRRVTT